MDKRLIVGLGEFLDDRSLELAARAIPYVRPIYGATPNGEIDAIGTAVLARRTQNRYLATAKHLLEHNADIDRDEGTSLYVGMPDGEVKEHLIETKAIVVKDPYDIAVLPCDFLEDYPPVCSSTRTRSLSMTAPTSPITTSSGIELLAAPSISTKRRRRSGRSHSSILECA